MYPLTHAWFTRRLWKEPSDSMLLGALLPDTIITTGLNWGLTHRPGNDLLMRLASRGEAHTDFALGWLSHAVEPHGIDYFGDDMYPGTERGYCFELARPYAERAARICGISSDLGWWKAHNFIEMGIEIIAARDWREVGERCRFVLDHSEEHRDVLEAVASELETQSEVLVGGYRMFPEYLQFDDISPKGLAVSYERQVTVKHDVTHIDVDDATDLICTCVSLVEESLEAFLDYSEREVLIEASKLR